MAYCPASAALGRLVPVVRSTGTFTSPPAGDHLGAYAMAPGQCPDCLLAVADADHPRQVMQSSFHGLG